MVLNRYRSLIVLLLAALVVGACSAVKVEGLFPASPAEGSPTQLPTPVPPRVLSICLGEEPDSLFLYGDLSTSAEIIRQAIYDSPIDEVDFERTSALLARIPSLENGLVTLVPVEVQPGERLVDAGGNLTILASGIRYRPAGCSDRSCWEQYQDQETILVDQVEIRYEIRPGLTWSDGTALTAADSIFSAQVARQVYGDSGPAKNRFAYSYDLINDQEVLWKGLPGYQGIYDYGDLFFPPLPEHLWSNLTREELLTSAQTTQKPLSFGPYQVAEWIRGDHLTLIRNESYASAGEGLPAFSSLVFRFVAGGEEALAAFRAGECQIVANEPELVDFQAEILADQASGNLALYTSGGSAWEQLSFGIETDSQQPGLVADSELRRVLAECIDRQGIADSRIDAGQVVDDFFLPGDPRLEPDPEPIRFQPVEAGLRLRDLGWIDQDGDPATPRISEGVAGVEDGTPLQLTLLAPGEDQIPYTVSEIARGLNSCGVGIEIELQPAAVLLAPGPEGPIFGRNFDLAYFAWAAGHYQPCRLFLTDEIPGQYPEFPKGWGGVNASGFSSQEYDLACEAVSTNLPDSAISQQGLQELRNIFQAELPAIPLFFRRELIIADPGLEGLKSGIYDLFWDIEGLR